MFFALMSGICSTAVPDIVTITAMLALKPEASTAALTEGLRRSWLFGDLIVGGFC
jgi:hypothetical protein